MAPKKEKNQAVVATVQKTYNVIATEPLTDGLGMDIHTGTNILIPEEYKDNLNEVGRFLMEKQEQNEKKTNVTHEIDGLYWDGAHALFLAMVEMFGTVQGKDIQTMFGTQLPEVRNVQVGFDKTAAVPMGRFAVPGLEGGYIETSYSRKNGRIIFAFSAVIKGKYKGHIARLANLARKMVETNSIYRGQAFKLNFTTDEGERNQFPEPIFMDLSRETYVTFNREIDIQIQSNIWIPITDTDRCRQDGIPLKRGILLAGPYGTGKTLVANKTAKLASQNGWTFIYCAAAELPEAINFAQLYMPCVIFAEDIDREVGGQERTKAVDNVLNAVDGVDNKNSEIMVVLTTNHLDQINQAMVRPGRIDTVIQTHYPDALTVGTLIRHYGGSKISTDTNLQEVGEILAGLSPANVREVVERAKLYHIQVGGEPNAPLSDDSLISAAKEIRQQVNLTEQKVNSNTGDLKGMEILGDRIGAQIGESVRKTIRQMK
jgi:transitional endoplasmic reticulum ATPase